MAKPNLRLVKSKTRPQTVGKRIRFDRDTWNAVEVLAQDQMKDIPEIVEEAMRDLLKKHGRSADFRQQLRLSAAKTNAKNCQLSAPRTTSNAIFSVICLGCPSHDHLSAHSLFAEDIFESAIHGETSRGSPALIRRSALR